MIFITDLGYAFGNTTKRAASVVSIVVLAGFELIFQHLIYKPYLVKYFRKLSVNIVQINVLIVVRVDGAKNGQSGIYAAFGDIC